MTTPRHKRWAPAAVIAGLFAIALGGGYYFFDQFKEAQDQEKLTQFFGLRQSFIAYVELQRLYESFDRVALREDGDADIDLEEVRQQVDFLAVRIDEIRRTRLENGAPNEREYVEAIERLITLATAAAAEGRAGLRRAAPRLAELKADIDRTAIHRSNNQWAAERDFVIGKAEALERMLYTAAALFALFVTFCALVLVMLRRETRARRKANAAEERATFLAYYDELTGLCNRRHFNDLMEHEFRTGNLEGVVIIDVDDFKDFNDNYGHDVGDAVLREVAARLRRTAGEHDGEVARLGGDEFAALIRAGGEATERFCRDVVDALRAPISIGRSTLSPHATIGGAMPRRLAEGARARPTDLLKAADRALYAAKNAGKNRYALFDQTLEEEMRREHALERDLERAIAEDELFLVFQPQIDMTTGEVVGFEALSRWRNRGEMIRPDIFIAAAERTGQVQKIDVWALRTAAETLAEWRADGLRPVRVSVNLSPLNFNNNAIIDHVAEAIERLDLPPRLLCFEVTENVVLKDFDRAAQVLARLSALGVELALDDFGSGFSSIGQLRRLDLEELKIDRTLVNGVVDCAEDRAVLATLSELAAALDMKSVVEGVETAEQRAALVELGYRTAQGFYFARPMPAEEARALLASGGRVETAKSV